MTKTAHEFHVRRDDLTQTRWMEAPSEPALEPGEALLQIDRFGLTANNITYAVVGEMMRYWEFFPAPEGWGRIPVWGFANVAASRVDGVREGDRVFGYLPISTLLRVRPERVTELGFADASPHRVELPPVYQQYARTQPSEPEKDAARAVIQPLFGTGFLIDDFLVEQKLFGARQVVFASASSRTALAAAFVMSRRAGRDFELVGLTSPRNRSFCERTGYYDRVVTYDEIGGLPASTPTVLVDMAGDIDVIVRVHRHFGAALRYSCLVGMTHQPTSLAPPADLPGPAPQFFFAPTQVEQRRKDWGMPEFNRRVSEAQSAFLESATWLEYVFKRGQSEIEAAYREVLAGRAAPNMGYVLSL